MLLCLAEVLNLTANLLDSKLSLPLGCMKNEKGHPLISVVKLLLMEGQTCNVASSVQASRKLHVIEVLVLHEAGGGGHLL